MRIVALNFSYFSVL